MKVTLPYGHKKVSFEIPDKNFIGMMDPEFTPAIENLERAIENAIDNPIGTKPLSEIVKLGKKIAVIIDDDSRPTPQSVILPILLPKLEAAGAKPEDIRIVAALGSHRYMTEDELRRRVGDAVYDRYEVINSEFKKPEGLVYVGKTPEGVDIMATKAVMETDIHIGVGCLLPHPVMGWGGGGKILFPGIAGEDTVSYFHLKASLYDEPLFGCDCTPVREMMEGWVDSIGLDFIINVVLNSKFEIADVVSGHYIKAQREGVQRGKRVIGYHVTEKADVMITSSHPADQDFWQSPKAMFAAEPALKGKKGGTLVLVSPNYEGMGPHPGYAECMGSDNGDDMVNAAIRGEKFLMDSLSIAVGNGMAKLRKRRRLITVGDGVSPEEMKTAGSEHGYIRDLQKIIDTLIKENPDCRIGAVSNGAETLLYI
ncbi:MAG: nickel-dependent lactate racemase [Oscillospiraceae bacterium]|nr:nickel-dependent lactate racemase [Oscillospiraceae bacterium]